jgi:hypothetical protein
MRRLNLPFISLPKKFSNSGAPGCCGSALGGEWTSIVGTECDGGGLPAGPGGNGGGLPTGGPGGDGGGLPAGPGCDGGDGEGLSAGGCDGESSVDPGCDPGDDGGLEVAVSESDSEPDAVLSELIVFHSVTDSSVRYPAFVDDRSPGSIRFSDAAIQTLATSTASTRTSFISRTATGAASTKLKMERIRRI